MAIRQKQAFCPDCGRNTLHVRSTLPWEVYHCQVCGRAEPFPCLQCLVLLVVLVGGCFGFFGFCLPGCPSTHPTGPAVDTKAAAEQAAAAREAERKQAADAEAKRISDAAIADAERKAKAKLAADEIAAEAMYEPGRQLFVSGHNDKAAEIFRKVISEYPDTKAAAKAKDIMKTLNK